MTKSVLFIFLMGVGSLTVSGCASQSQFLASKQGMAIQTAVSRGQFDLNCPTATGGVISREVVQPALVGPWVQPIPRAEYTIGVQGCGRRHSYVVICPEGGEGCFAAGPGMFHGWQQQ
jgi:hypothetical protein